MTSIVALRCDGPNCHVCIAKGTNEVLPRNWWFLKEAQTTKMLGIPMS